MNKCFPNDKIYAVRMKTKDEKTEKICIKLFVQLNYSCLKNLSMISINKTIS